MVNPLSFARVGFSAGIDQANDKPMEWGQGASGYGRRFANILGQYSIQRTVTYGLGRALHEDNRYFNSGRQGFWWKMGAHHSWYSDSAYRMSPRSRARTSRWREVQSASSRDSLPCPS